MSNPSSTKQSKLLSTVFQGKFPKKAVYRMTRSKLEKFVLKLVEFSSNVSAKEAKNFSHLYRGLCLKEINEPEWWPSERVISQTLTSNGKYFLELLRFLVYKCCEYFKKPSENLNRESFVTVNDENRRRPKRKCTETICQDLPTKRRRTLMPTNATLGDLPRAKGLTSPQNPIIVLKSPNLLNRETFFDLLGLRGGGKNLKEKPTMSGSISTAIKFNSCSVIPISSELGQELMKRDNHNCPEATISHYREKLERYINRSPLKRGKVDYEVTYKNKPLTLRRYNFPKRQFAQFAGDSAEQKKALFCQPFNVVLRHENLNRLQEIEKRKSCQKLQVLLPKITIGNEKSASGQCQKKKKKAGKLQKCRDD